MALIVLPALGIGLASRYHADPSHLVDESARLYWFFGLAIVGLVGALGRTIWRSPSRRGGIVVLVTCGILWSVGLTKAANTMLDRSRPTLYRSSIAKRYEATGRDGAYYLRLAPWGPVDDEDDVAVPRSMYRQTQVGDTVCLLFHRGFLHAPWYVLVPCRAPFV